MIRLTATRSGPDIFLSWTDDTNFGVYTIMRAGPDSGTYYMLAMVRDVLHYVDRNVPNAMMSYYATGDRSNTVNVGPAAPVPPDPPDPTPGPPDAVIAHSVGGINVLTPLAQRHGIIAEVGVIGGRVHLIFHAVAGTRTFPAAPVESPDATTVWATDTELWLWSSGTAYRVALDRPGLPEAITITRVTAFVGVDADSRNAPSIGLDNGGFIGAWTQHTPPPGTDDLTVGFAYCNPAGQWSTARVIVPADGGGNITGCTVAMCQHPVDARIWAFIKRDGYHWIASVELYSDASRLLVVDRITPQFISQEQDGDNGPEGEFPDLKALPDPATGTIRLAYQCKVAWTFDPDVTHFIKGAQITIAAIDEVGDVTFPLPRLEQWVERSTSLSLSLVGGQPVLGYRYLGPDGTANDLRWSQWDGQAWTPPALLSTTRLPQSALGDSRTFWIVEQNGDLRQVTP